MMWRPWRRPRTEARTRWRDGQWGLTPEGPLRKGLGHPLRGRLDRTARQGGQRGRISLAGDQGLDDGAPAPPRDVGQPRAELDVGVLQRLLQPLDVAGALADQLLAGAQQ